jgi:hypothetical protein
MLARMLASGVRVNQALLQMNRAALRGEISSGGTGTDEANRKRKTARFFRSGWA